MAADLKPRLAATAARTATLKAELKAETDRRDSLVCRAIAEGNTYRAVARAAGLSVGRVAAIVGTYVPVAEALAGSGQVL